MITAGVNGDGGGGGGGGGGGDWGGRGESIVIINRYLEEGGAI